jgi:hypothetical protein
MRSQMEVISKEYALILIVLPQNTSYINVN